MVGKWRTLSSEKIADLKIFDAYEKVRENPATGAQGKFVALDSADWVNIVPVTSAGNIVMVEQYRHGTDSIVLELPGGLANRGEEPSIAAARECAEETGYGSAEAPVYTGYCLPNPAFLNNKCTSFAWFDCKPLAGQTLDEHEIIDIHEFTPGQIKSMIEKGEINHGVILTAFFFFFNKFKL
ncbi:MAG: NUDIX hydrolase [Chloroflexota bacterium]